MSPAILPSTTFISRFYVYQRTEHHPWKADDDAISTRLNDSDSGTDRTRRQSGRKLPVRDFPDTG